MWKKGVLQGILALIVLLASCSNSNNKSLPLDKLHLSSGFSIRIYAKVPGARSLTLGQNGIVYVGTRKVGKVYAVIPNEKQTHAEKVVIIGSDMEMPNGVAYRDGDLYVAEMSRIWRYRNIEKNLNRPQRELITDQLPDKTRHGWRFIKFGPDGWLYVAIGAPCNVCVSQDPRFATISRLQPNGQDFQIYAKGIRNSVGFDWHPVTKKLWFTDNGRDWLGDNLPPDELNYAPHAGMDFGFPYFYGDNVPDPQYGRERSSQGMTIPAKNLDPHVAALGLSFYTGKMFPKSYWNQIIIAEHGSWNRSKKDGYRLTTVTVNGNKAVSYQPFVTGWLQGQSAWGRPVDTLVMPDGSLLVSDDYAGVIYRIIYDKSSVR